VHGKVLVVQPGTFLVVAVFEDGTARITETVDVADILSTWRRRYPMPFAPVVAHRVSMSSVLETFDAYDIDMPQYVTTDLRAALSFGWAPVDSDALRPVISHLRQLGPHQSGRLLRRWDSAIDFIAFHARKSPSFATEGLTG
jgi:hypothetical protein